MTNLPVIMRLCKQRTKGQTLERCIMDVDVDVDEAMGGNVNVNVAIKVRQRRQQKVAASM